MHPYEMASTMRERHQEESIKINYGSLYTVVSRLQEAGLIAEKQTISDGKRPPKTIYELTDLGVVEFEDWLEDLLGGPACEYTGFEAGLCLMSGLSVDQVLDALRRRLEALNAGKTSMRSIVEDVVSSGVPRLYLIEHEYRLAMREAEHKWIKKLINQIETEALDGVQSWKKGRCWLTESGER